jgi:hypothetical protein
MVRTVPWRAACFVLSALALAGCEAVLGLGNQSPLEADGGSPTSSSQGAASLQWPGFVDLGAFGDQCTAAIATVPASAAGPLTFIPCTSGEANCEEVKWDGAITWAPAGENLLVFDMQIVFNEAGQSTRLLLRHHYPPTTTAGTGYGTLPYEAVLYDLASGAPLFVLRNVGGTGPFGAGSNCFVVPVASPDGVWLAGTDGNSGKVQVAYLALPSGAFPTFRASSVDTTFVNNLAVAFDDRLATEQDDGRIVVDSMGQSTSTYGPGEHVSLSSTVGDRFLTVNPNGSDGGVHHFTLDPSMQFATYGGSAAMVSDGAEIAYFTTAGSTLEAWTASVSDGTSGAQSLTTVSSPSCGPPGYFGSAVGDNTYALLTYASGSFSNTNPVTGTIVALDGGQSWSADIGAQESAFQMQGSLQFLGYAKPYLLFGEVGDAVGLSKIVRIRAPGQ